MFVSGYPQPRVSDARLLRALVLAESACSGACVTELRVEHFDRLRHDVPRASQAAVVLVDTVGDLGERRGEILAWCGEVLRPEGVLVLSAPGESNREWPVLKSELAARFGHVELFGWDGLVRTTAGAEQGTLLALCRPFQPYAARSLELMRPSVVARGGDWRCSSPIADWSQLPCFALPLLVGRAWESSCLCERPALPERFLLRATLEVIGEAAAVVDVRFGFHASGRDRYEIIGRFTDTASGAVELLLSSQLAKVHGDPAWGEVERITLAARADRRVDVRLAELRVFSVGNARRPATARRSSARSEVYDSASQRSSIGRDEVELELEELVNVHRAYALLATPAPARAMHVGSGRGELALRLLGGGSEVTLVGYSAAAMKVASELLGEHPRARLVFDDAANLDLHVPAGSQDAIFMTDLVERLSVEELRATLRACRRALAPEGMLAIHTPERYSGAIATAKAVHGSHIHLYEIDTLRELLEDVFGAVEVFTWDGLECFHERGRCIELFALASPEAPGVAHPLAVTALGGAGESQDERAIQGACAISCPGGQSRFLLDMLVEIHPATARGELEILVQSATGRTLARAARELTRLRTLPARLRLASELLMPGSQSDCEQVERIVVRVRSRGSRPVQLKVSEVRMKGAYSARGEHAAPQLLGSGGRR